jgi:hypothetical protein
MNYHKLYLPLCVLLLFFSPILFLMCNPVFLCVLRYYKISYWELFKLNCFLFIVLIFFCNCYMYLLSHEPSIPFYPGDSVVLNSKNLVLIVGYSAKFPSIFRATFVETIVVLHVISNVLGCCYPTLFFFI